MCRGSTPNLYDRGIIKEGVDFSHKITQPHLIVCSDSQWVKSNSALFSWLPSRYNFQVSYCTWQWKCSVFTPSGDRSLLDVKFKADLLVLDYRCFYAQHGWRVNQVTIGKATCWNLIEAEVADCTFFHCYYLNKRYIFGAMWQVLVLDWD